MNNHQPLSIEQLQRDVANILHEDVAEIGLDDSLIDFGLDSMRAMTLVTRWREQGANITFQQAAQTPTIRQWHQIISNNQSA